MIQVIYEKLHDFLIFYNRKRINLDLLMNEITLVKSKKNILRQKKGLSIL